MPDTLHAVSVSLPAWVDVIGYEEKEPRVLDALRACYPRFVFHPLVREVFSHAERELCGPGEKCLILPSYRAAELCGEFLGETGSIYGLLAPEEERFGAVGPHAIVFPISALPKAKCFWQHTGYILSSRAAEWLLAGKNPAPADNEETLLKKRIAGLSGADAEDVYLFPGGMAAIFTAHQALQALDPGKKTIQLGFPYVDTLKIQEKFGEEVIFIPESAAHDLAALETLVAKGDVGAVYTEFPTNPLLHAIDVEPLKNLLHKYGVKLVVDDTIATWVNADILPHADIVATSLTKSFSGSGDVLGGSLIINNKSPYYSAIKQSLLKCYHNICFAEDIRVLERNSRDGVERIGRTNANAEALCDFLNTHPKVARVHYPKFTNPDTYNKYKKKGGGYGCLFSLILKDPKDAPRFYDALDIPKGPSFGNDFTLACPYTLMAHYDELQQVNAHGVASELIRVSVGLEDAETLITRFRAALG